MGSSTSSDLHPWRWLGVLILASCAVVTGVLLYKGRILPVGVRSIDPAGISIYGIFPGVFTAALACVGVILSAFRGRAVRSIAAGAGVVLAGQLAGTAMFAVKHWVASQGFSGPYDNLAYLEVAAATMGVVMTIAWVACVAELVHGRSFPIRTEKWIRIGGVVAGVAVILLGDIMSPTIGSGGPTRIGFALVLTLPCGVALAGAGWSTRAPALAVCVTVAVTSMMQVSTKPIVNLARPVGPVVAIVAACVLVGWTRLTVRPIDRSLP